MRLLYEQTAPTERGQEAVTERRALQQTRRLTYCSPKRIAGDRDPDRGTTLPSYYNPARVSVYVSFVTPPRCFASRLPNCRGFIYDPTAWSSHFNIFKKNHPCINISMNNRITVCSYYAQLSTTPSEQLCIIVQNVIRIFYDCPSLRKTFL